MRTKLSPPPLIYGTAWKKERTAVLVEKAIRYGFSGIDTACQPRHYQEASVGDALKRLFNRGIRREDLFIQTKFTPIDGQDIDSVPYDRAAPLKTQVHQSFAASLKNLKVDYIDSWLIHSPLSTHEQTMEVWSSMEEVYSKGFVGMLGISNIYDLSALKLIHDEAKVKPAVVQNRFYRETHYDKALRRWCHEKEIYYQGFWTLTANGHLFNHPVLQGIAAAKKLTLPQLFYRFLTLQNVIPLIGTTSEKHMQQDLAIFDFTLSEDEIRQIEALL